MFRFSRNAHMKPFLHAFSPGVRPSEKGLLYRNGYMNAFSRLEAIDPEQQTALESKIRARLNFPELTAEYFFVLLSASIVFPLYMYGNRYITKPLNSYFCGLLDEFGQYERLDEMEQVTQLHKTEISNAQSEITQPKVFSPVGEYTSPSHMYSSTQNGESKNATPSL